jgi:hypothetical protein
MTEENVQYGTPSMLLLPSANYKFTVTDDTYRIVIPRKGKYFDLDPDFFSEEDGEFNLYDEKTKSLYMPSISKVLYATKKYPDLEANQLFAPTIIKCKKDKVEIYGQVINMLIP